MATSRKVHPACDAFPMMSDAEIKVLAEDILEHGQQEDVVYWKGMLVDGRNRIAACEIAGVEPGESELSDDVDPVAFIISANLHRRHLTTSQRSVVAAKMATLKNGQHGKAPSNGGATTAAAAKLLSIGTRSVERAKDVVTRGSPALVHAVEAGDVSVSLAAQLVDEVDDKQLQTRLTKQGAKAIREYITPKDDAFDFHDASIRIEDVLKRELNKWPDMHKPAAIHLIREILDKDYIES